MAVRSVSDFRMTKGASRCRPKLRLDRGHPPFLPFPYLAFLLFFQPPLVAAPPPTFLACRGNKSRKCYRKEFTRQGEGEATFCLNPPIGPVTGSPRVHCDEVERNEIEFFASLHFRKVLFLIAFLRIKAQDKSILFLFAYRVRMADEFFFLSSLPFYMCHEAHKFHNSLLDS